jgi:hypothetical protein
MKIHFVGVVAAIYLAGCGPGVLDTTYPILGGYAFSDAGGPEKTIFYQGNAAPEGIVIDARVDKYRIIGNRIIVARRPRILIGEKPPIMATLSAVCEHWVIDTTSHTVSKIDDSELDAPLECYSQYSRN